jgi:hypothetical protein
MTGDIVIDFFVYLVIAGIGGAATYWGWLLLLDKPKQTTEHR